MPTASDMNFSFFSVSVVLTTCIVTACSVAVGVWFSYRSRRQRGSVNKKVATVTGLFIYPVKSCQPTPVNTAQCEARGFTYDRRWVVVDTLNSNAPSGSVGLFLTQKQQPKLAQIKPSVQVDPKDGSVFLRLNAPNMTELEVKCPDEANATACIEIYRIAGEAIDCGDEVAAWLCEFIPGMPGLRLYYMSESTRPRRLVTDSKWGALDTLHSHSQVAYANFSPYLMANEKSLAELNGRLEEDVSMQRFRANIVIDSCAGHHAFSEDNWANLTIGGVAFRMLKKCGRCPMTTLDPDTGRRLGAEPLKTLKTYRLDTSDERYGPSPCFGVNLESLSSGQVSVGDDVVLVC